MSGDARLPGGFAPAANPIPAQAIHTTAQGLDNGEVSIPTADGTIPAYFAAPPKGVALPLVLVVQEIFGVHEYIRDVCRRLAHAGYCAIAPDLYYRQGDTSQMKDWNEIRTKVVAKVPDAQVISDLDATVRFARRRLGGYVSFGYHRFLLGRAHRVAVCRAQSRVECGRGLVWKVGA